MLTSCSPSPLCPTATVRPWRTANGAGTSAAARPGPAMRSAAGSAVPFIVSSTHGSYFSRHTAASYPTLPLACIRLPVAVSSIGGLAYSGNTPFGVQVSFSRTSTVSSCVQPVPLPPGMRNFVQKWEAFK